jgi:exoribonuclease R
MLQTHELSDTHKCDLELLHEIGDAHAALLRAKGGVDQNFPPRAKTSVSISKEIREQSYSGDPTIQLSTVGGTTGSNATLPIQGNLVQSFMLVAAQVAARWCNERGIPVAYRVTPRNPAKEDPSEFFLRKVVPSRAQNGVASTDITSEYLRLIGGVLPSTTPGPHAAVGVDMMVRCTSPLRRFTDLLVHWQIGATLLEEDRLGQPLVGNTKDDFLPFSRARVDALLSRLDTREKLIKYGKNEADRHWLCFYLLRAWEFKEAEIPSTFPFLVRNVNLEERKISGMLTDFTARAQCSVPDDMDLERIQEGDKLEVELENVNVYTRKIEVKAVRRLEVHGDV